MVIANYIDVTISCLDKDGEWRVLYGPRTSPIYLENDCPHCEGGMRQPLIFGGPYRCSTCRGTGRLPC